MADSKPKDTSRTSQLRKEGFCRYANIGMKAYSWGDCSRYLGHSAESRYRHDNSCHKTAGCQLKSHMFFLPPPPFALQWNRICYYWSHYWPIVPAPDDDDDECGAIGGKVGRGKPKYCTRRKPTPVPLCPPQIPHDLDPGSISNLRGGKPATNRRR
jgi:hypothetical protein